MRLSLQSMFIRLVMLLAIMPIHEYAHALVAYKLGDNTARFNGRMTLNPMAHLDLFGSIAFILAGFGWGKPVPIYGSNLRKPKRDMALVALAGPVSNVLLGTILVVIYKVLGVVFMQVGFTTGLARAILVIIFTLAQTSVYWAVFNLIPVPPLDGSRLLEYILPHSIYYKIEYYQRYIYIALLVLLFSGILMGPIVFVSNFIMKFILFITSPLDLLLNLFL